MEPVITHALFTSIRVLENAVRTLHVNCVEGITANSERTPDMVLRSLGIVTLLNPPSGTPVRRDRTRGIPDRKVAPRDRGRGTRAAHAGAVERVFSFENLIDPAFDLKV